MPANFLGQLLPALTIPARGGCAGSPRRHGGTRRARFLGTREFSCFVHARRLSDATDTSGATTPAPALMPTSSAMRRSERVGSVLEDLGDRGGQALWQVQIGPGKAHAQRTQG